MRQPKLNDAKSFARSIVQAAQQDVVHLGHFALQGKKGVAGKLWYNHDPVDLIQGRHDYTFHINDGPLEVSLQLWLNINAHFKFRAVTRINGVDGVVFSVNLTTQKESKDIIYLTNKIRFSEKYRGETKLATDYRRQKQMAFASILRKLNYDVTDNNDVLLGIYDPVSGKFVNTAAEKFLEDFLVISILKGHFMGNKGYDLEILPTFTLDGGQGAEAKEVSVQLPKRFVKNKSSRSIPLAYRYSILKRDKFKCVACGRCPDDGVKLHIDHKIPFSLGGTTELKNLQTLCDECNISKSNRFVD